MASCKERGEKDRLSIVVCKIPMSSFLAWPDRRSSRGILKNLHKFRDNEECFSTVLCEAILWPSCKIRVVICFMHNMQKVNISHLYKGFFFFLS